LAERDRHQSHRRTIGQVSNKTEADAVALGNAGDSKVRRGADEGAVAAEAGAEREAPP
jgi:hypothetical protein